MKFYILIDLSFRVFYVFSYIQRATKQTGVVSSTLYSATCKNKVGETKMHQYLSVILIIIANIFIIVQFLNWHW